MNKRPFGSTCTNCSKFVDDVRSTHLPNKEDANYEDMLNETHVIISNRYKTDSTLWQAVYDSIITKLS